MASGLASETEERAAELGIALPDPEVLRLLEARAKETSALSILEVGTGLGAGTLALAQSAPDARIVTIERDAELLSEAQSLFEKASLGDRLKGEVGEARDLLPRLSGPFDLVVLDCDLADRIRCLDLALQKLVVGGLLIVAPPLFGFEDPPEWSADLPEEEAEAIFSFYGYFSMHPQLSATVEPVGDGVGVATKKRPLVTELGGPF